MPNWLKQSTSVEVGVGPFLDDTDGKTAKTALTITQPDVRLKKNGAAWIQKNAAQTLAHEEAGWYEVTLDATDTNTLGILIVAIHEVGALPVWKEYTVVPANVYDSLVANTDIIDVNVNNNEVAAIAQINATVDIALVDAGVTTVRTGYLDKLNVTGNIASSGEAQLAIKLLKAQPILDISTTPITLKLIEQGTGTFGAGYLDGTILRTFYLYRPDGVAVTPANYTTSVVGSQRDS